MHAQLTPATFHPALFLIPTLPLVGAAVNGLFGAKLMARFGPRINHRIAIALPSLSAIIALWAFVDLIALPAESRALWQNCFPFIHIGFLDADMAFWLDPLAATMTLIITIIGTLIHVYSVGYMKGDASYWRFFAYMNLFMASMLVLVLADNFLVLFIGWEGVGLCSYLLIAFWYQDRANAVAGMKAFVVNRIGDFGVVIGVALLFWGQMGDHSGAIGRSDGYDQGFVRGQPVTAMERLELGSQQIGLPAFGHRPLPTHVLPASVRFDAVRARVAQQPSLWTERAAGALTFMGIPLVVLVCVLLFVGACGKSAQIPLYVWLPDAMAGPTPVSALIHAATMVTAGVYLVARLNFLYVLSPTAMTVVAVVGALTALYAATIGLFQYDIKKVLAYSTVSQLGYMFIGVGVGAYWAGVYHLLTHAVFKALLFLGSGSVILGCHHEQDMRKMGGLKKFMPITHWTYWAACCAITTAPFFFLSNGFFSKDEILWKAFDARHLLVPGWSIWLLGFVGAGLTSFYMWRSYYMTFTGEHRGHGAVTSAHAHAAGPDHDNRAAHHPHGGGDPHESPRSITAVLATLGVFILVTITLGLWPLILHNQPAIEHWLHPVMGAATEALPWSDPHHVRGLELGLALASTSLALASWLVARALYKSGKSPWPARLLASPSPLLRLPYKLVYNKYFVDEVYDWAVVRRARNIAQRLFRFDQRVIDALVNFMPVVGRALSAIDGLFDTLIVDGAVNAVASGSAAIGRTVRRAHTGRIQTYLFAAAAGAMLLVVVNYLLF